MSNEIEKINKRLKATERDIIQLRDEHFGFLKVMAVESCATVFNIYLIMQKGEELDKFLKLWKKRLDDAKQELEKTETINDVVDIRDKFIKDITDYVKAAKVDTADKAMEIAHSFIKKYSPVALPLKAVRKNDVWLVDIDVGALAVKIAKVKVDAKTGDILSYDIPEKK